MPSSKERSKSDKARRLAVFADGANYDDPPVAVTLPDVLYAPPNPDGSRKKCENCAHWYAKNECLIMAPSVVVPGDAICGYHVFGAPDKIGERSAGLEPVLPENAGFEQTEDGTSCDLCKFYDAGKGAKSGKCRAVADPDGGSALVQALGCCARWRPL